MLKTDACLSAPAASIAAGIFLWISANAVAFASDADEEQTTIDQIVVVAHKDERSIREIAANVTVLSRAGISDELATSINDVFRYVPGIDYEGAGNRFGTEGINIRGIGGNRVAIVVDGVPLSDHFDVGSFSNATRDFIDAGLIENIEVLHGPASALYGSAAIGGVVAVRTPDPVDVLRDRRTGGDLLATWRGADDSVQGQALVGLGDDALGLTAGYTWRSGHEVDSAAAGDSLDTRETDRKTALLKLVADDQRGNTWRASLIHQDSHTLSSLTSMLGAGRYRSTTALEGDDQYNMDLLTVSYEFGAPEGWIDNGVVRGYYEIADVEQKTLDERANARTPVSIDRFFSFEQQIAGLELNLWKDFSTARAAHRLGFGVEYRERETEEYRDGLSTDLTTGEQTNVLLGEVFPLRDFPITTTREFGAYLEDTMNFGDWTVIAALRADRFELSPSQDPMYLEDYPFAEIVSLTESELSPKLGVIYKISPGIDVYAQYSHGFRAPPYADANIGLEIPLFNYRAIPNPDLKSESSDGIDIGMRWQGLSSSAHVSLFHTRYEDFIESKVRLGADPVSGRILFQSQNIDETRIEGIEAGWSVRWNAIGFDGSAYYAQGTNKQNNEPLNSVGPAQAVIGLSWYSEDESRQVRLKATLTDAWDDRDETSGELFEPPGHAVFDLFFSQQLGEKMTFRAGLHNLTDRTYWNWSDVRGLSSDDPVIPYLAQAGRSASVSLNVRW
ncbi:MAG: TonB-dependent hemoglobin/transferrin/lactoferrin family receptor [Woeseiaceae bacterium]|nr:TonB-dependent hemoglobin/transferrin/lactoferrin family receptor [Woeseiaceae bacterium]NIP19574.1 TonB-dependent hemoglobin/transferrin/lactoferrin family receptor [Woeseiaceae bacterium]